MEFIVWLKIYEFKPYFSHVQVNELCETFSTACANNQYTQVSSTNDLAIVGLALRGSFKQAGWVWIAG